MSRPIRSLTILFSSASISANVCAPPVVLMFEEPSLLLRLPVDPRPNRAMLSFVLPLLSHPPDSPNEIVAAPVPPPAGFAAAPPRVAVVPRREAEEAAPLPTMWLRNPPPRDPPPRASQASARADRVSLRLRRLAALSQSSADPASTPLGPRTASPPLVPKRRPARSPPPRPPNAPLLPPP